MKTTIKYHYAILFATVTTLLAGCSTKSNKWNNLEFYQIEKAKQITEEPDTLNKGESIYSVLHDEGIRELDIKVDMQFIKSDNFLSKKISQLINKQLIEILLKQSSDSLSIDEAIAHYIEDVKSEFQGDKVVKTYYDHLTGRAEYGFENIINYFFTEEEFTGGAHPCTITTILRFNALTGDFVPLESVFPLANQAALREVLLNQLMQDNQVTTMAELHKKGYLEMMEMFVSPNFTLRTDSIDFFYNVYDIAPYAYGPTTISISYDDVSDLLGGAFDHQ